MQQKAKARQNIRQSAMSKFFKIRFIFVSIALFSLVAIALGLIFASNRHEDEHNHIVNILGRQRMYSQSIAQHASRIASLYEAIDSGQGVQSPEILSEKLKTIKFELANTANRFGSILQDLQQGYIPYKDAKLPIAATRNSIFRETLKDLDSEWKGFTEAVTVIVESNTKNPSFRRALILINERNTLLLSHSERLTDLVLESFAKNHQYGQIAISLLIALLVFLSIWILFTVYRYIIEPYTIFYNGMKSLDSVTRPPKAERSAKSNPLMQEVQETITVMRELIHTIGAINQGTSFFETIHLIFNTFHEYIPYNYIGIATFSGYKGDTLKAIHGESDGTLNNLPHRLFGLKVKISDTSLSQIIETGKPRIINDLPLYAQTRPNREYTRIILEEGVKSSITLPITINNKTLGFLFFSSTKRYAYTDIHVDFLKNIRNAIALSFEKSLFVDEIVYSSTLALAKMAEAKDEDTGDHLERMKKYTVLLASNLKHHPKYASSITPEFLLNIERFSPMHDIGKVGIRDNVLTKPGRLDAVEMTHMRTHARYGADVLREAENNIARSGRTLFKMGIAIADGHHEWWDGSGYPEGLAGTNIPLEARIVAVSDVFDALTSRRPYKEPFPFDKTVTMITEESGTHFDPDIVAVLIENIADFRDLYEHFIHTMPEAFLESSQKDND